MKNIITIAGSNSKKSINRLLVKYVATQLENIESININLNDYEMPLYGIDIEKEKGFPKSALQLNEIFNQADGFIISLAEHNGSYSVVSKNILDWLSRTKKSMEKQTNVFDGNITWRKRRNDCFKYSKILFPLFRCKHCYGLFIPFIL